MSGETLASCGLFHIEAVHSDWRSFCGSIPYPLIIYFTHIPHSL